jgi:hypothetical protein
MSQGLHRAWALTLTVVLGAVASCDTPGFDTNGVLTRSEFHCLTVSESMRTIAPARLERKRVQVTRIERLLLLNLDDLDNAKLLAERAVLTQEIEETRFLYDCAETYYAPGSTGLRPSFGHGPSPYDAAKVGRAFHEATERSSPRHRPHGFEERTALHTAEASLAAGERARAAEIANTQLRATPTALFADSLEIIAADAQLALGQLDDAAELYRSVGNLPIGVDAHYARYRTTEILHRRGDDQAARSTRASVLRWADRGDRDALASWLRQTAPLPPLPVVAPPK